jgi:hypothetical protein
MAVELPLSSGNEPFQVTALSPDDGAEGLPTRTVCLALVHSKFFHELRQTWDYNAVNNSSMELHAITSLVLQPLNATSSICWSGPTDS